MEEGREREEEWSMKENCQFLKVNLMVPLTRFSIVGHAYNRTQIQN